LIKRQKKITRAQYCLPLFLLFSTLWSASVSGYVRNNSNGEPLAYANVMIVELGRGTATDVHGFYIIPRLPSGHYTLQVRMIGFKTEKIPVEITDENLRRDVNLVAAALNMDEITVSGEQYEFKRNLDVSRTNLTARELRMSPAFVEDDVFRTFQLLPSVTSLNDFSAALIVRGGSPDENLVNLDGTQIYNPYHIGGVFSTFNTDAISNAELIAGGYQVNYGGHLSSVINLTTKEGDAKNGRFPDDFFLKKYFDYGGGRMQISPLSSKFLLEGPSYKGSWFFSGRRTYFDQLAKAYYRITDKARPWNYYFWDVNFKMHTDLNSSNRLTYSGYSGRDDLYLDVGGEDFPEIEFAWIWGNTTNSLNWRYNPSADYLLETHVSQAKYYFDVDFTFTVDRESSFTDSTETSAFNAVMHNLVRDRSLSQEFTWFASEEHRVQAGWSYKILKMLYNEKFAGSTIINWDQSPFILAAYLKETWRPGPELAVDAGLRVTKYELYDPVIIDPRINFKYFLQSNFALKGSWGTYSQFLFTINKDDQLLRVVDFWQPISRLYKPQRAQHFVIGADYRGRDGVTLSLDLYYKPYSNILDISKVYHPSDGDVGFVSGTAKVYGAELLLKKTQGKLFGWLGYAYSFVERSLDYNNNGVLEREVGEIYRAKYDIPHSLNLVVNYEFSDINTLGFSLVTHSGQPFTPPSGKVFHQSQDIFGSMDNPFQRFDTYYGAKNSARYPAYLRLDFNYIRQISPWGLDGTFKLQVINLTNHFNVLLYNWQLEASPARATAYSMFPVILTFGWEFAL